MRYVTRNACRLGACTAADMPVKMQDSLSEMFSTRIAGTSRVVAVRAHLRCQADQLSRSSIDLENVLSLRARHRNPRVAPAVVRRRTHVRLWRCVCAATTTGRVRGIWLVTRAAASMTWAASRGRWQQRRAGAYSPFAENLHAGDCWGIGKLTLTRVCVGTLVKLSVLSFQTFTPVVVHPSFLRVRALTVASEAHCDADPT
eukprot:IDg17744t1